MSLKFELYRNLRSVDMQPPDTYPPYFHDSRDGKVSQIAGIPLTVTGRRERESGLRKPVGPSAVGVSYITSERARSRRAYIPATSCLLSPLLEVMSGPSTRPPSESEQALKDGYPPPEMMDVETTASPALAIVPDGGVRAWLSVLGGYARI